MPLGFHDNVHWNVLYEIGLAHIEYFLTAQVHKELREFLNLPLATPIHSIDLILDGPHELYEHKFHLDLLLILVPEYHALAVLLFGLNLLKDVFDRHSLFISSA